MNNLKNRGLEDILIAIVDGLKGFPDAINAAYPDTTVQTCIVHPLLICARDCRVRLIDIFVG
jgi:transposase-like protein